MSRRPKQTFRIGVSGSYGGLNLGDEAILKGIVTQLRRSLPPGAVEITVVSRDAEDTRLRHGAERVVPVEDVQDELIRQGANLRGVR